MDRRPADALFAINTLLLEQEHSQKPAPRSARVRLLRGLAGCMLGRAAAARPQSAAIELESEAGGVSGMKDIDSVWRRKAELLEQALVGS